MLAMAEPNVLISPYVFYDPHNKNSENVAGNGIENVAIILIAKHRSYSGLI